MHTVRRRAEPAKLGQTRQKYTRKWVDYYCNGRGGKPTDTLWRRFHSHLRGTFCGLCAYCEEACRGEVEHFRPKSRFPERVYKWSNWLFACHDCNHMKGEKWPRLGYVDPCARSRSAQPEVYFDFDTLTGQIMPASRITPAQRTKAAQMIGDLELNAYHHLKKRVQWLECVQVVLSAVPHNDPALARFTSESVSRKRPHSSITCTLLAQLGYPTP